MTGYILRRLAVAMVTIFAAATFVFVAARLTGDPLSELLPVGYTPQQEAAVKSELGLDKPFYVQYGIFLRHAAVADFGYSYRWDQSAKSLIGHRVPATLELAGLAFLIAAVIALPLGTFAAVHEGDLGDLGARALAITGQALPNFVLALLLVWLFSVKLRWLPVSGGGGINHIILPAVSLAWLSIAVLTRIVRSAVIDILHQDYIRTANAKGLLPHTVLTRHVLRSGLVPVVTMLGLQWQAFISGTVIIETVFAYPGVGSITAQAVNARDFPVVQTATVLFAVLFILINFLTDLATMAVDPRIRASSGLG